MPAGEPGLLEMPPRSIVTVESGAAPPVRPVNLGEPLINRFCRPGSELLPNAAGAGDVAAVKRLIAEGRLNVDALTTHTIALTDVDAGVSAIIGDPDRILGVVFEMAH